MAYAPKNLKLLAGELWNPDVPRLWAYKSADAIATVRAADYISDAKFRGVRQYDVVLVVDDNTPTASLCVVMTVDGDGADLSDGTAISVTNT